MAVLTGVSGWLPIGVLLISSAENMDKHSKSPNANTTTLDDKITMVIEYY